MPAGSLDLTVLSVHQLEHVDMVGNPPVLTDLAIVFKGGVPYTITILQLFQLLFM